jgi:hypothetical protein
MQINDTERSLDDALEMLVTFVHLARLSQPGSEERNRFLAMAAKLLDEERDAPPPIAD